jgi:hypothetical protein
LAAVGWLISECGVRDHSYITAENRLILGCGAAYSLNLQRTPHLPNTPLKKFIKALKNVSLNLKGQGPLK